MVATPIGNLGDLSPRALAILQTADIVYCEDTRHTRKLFSANQVSPAGRLLALHDHNEAELCQRVVERVSAGETVALVSDAGTPAVSDPGARVIAAVVSAGLTVTTTPGPSAVVAALTVSGLATDRFCFEGFLPRRAADLAARAGSWEHEERTVIFYESPKRIAETLRVLADLFPKRLGVVARELTKLHEEVVRGTMETLADQFRDREVLGEITVVLEGAAKLAPVTNDVLLRALANELANGVSVRDAAGRVATALDASRRHVYELALELRRGDT